MPIARSVPAITNLTGAEFDVGRGRFEDVRSDLPAGLDNFFAGLDDRVAADIIDFDPPVPPPAISWSLSPCTSLIRWNGMPSLVARICANGDRAPGRNLRSR